MYQIGIIEKLETVYNNMVDYASDTDLLLLSYAIADIKKSIPVNGQVLIDIKLSTEIADNFYKDHTINNPLVLSEYNRLKVVKYIIGAHKNLYEFSCGLKQAITFINDYLQNRFEIVINNGLIVAKKGV